MASSAIYVYSSDKYSKQLQWAPPKIMKFQRLQIELSCPILIECVLNEFQVSIAYFCTLEYLFNESISFGLVLTNILKNCRNYSYIVITCSVFNLYDFISNWSGVNSCCESLVISKITNESWTISTYSFRSRTEILMWE